MFALFRYLLLMALVIGLLFWGRPHGQQSCYDMLDADLIRLSGVCPVFAEGLGGVDTGRIDSRWGYGPETRLTFILANTDSVYLRYRISNPISGQGMEISANGVILKRYTDMPAQTGLAPWVEARIVFKGKVGINTVVFRYADWNHKSSSFVAEDSRPLAMSFTALQLFAQ